MNIIPFNKPYMTGKELYYIAEAHFNGRLAGDGPFTKCCHEWIESQTQSLKALLTHSCTAALEMSAILADIKPGDEVIMPSYTFVSTANAFVLRGAIPVFVDIRADTLNIDERLIEAAITPKTRAIVPVHYAGVGCEMDVIMEIAQRHKLLVIEDAAQGVMAKYKGKSLGSIGHLGALSFHETKNIIAGEGGALLINDERFKERAEVIREKGTNRSQFFRGQVDKYTWCDIGSSFLPGELIAAFLWAQMEEAETITRRRLDIWNIYHQAFMHLEQAGLVRRPVIPTECDHNAHMYYLLLPNLDVRTKFIEKLKSKGIVTVFHYVPLHLSLQGQTCSRISGNLLHTENLSDRLVRLPLWLGMEDEQARLIDEILETIYSIAKSSSIEYVNIADKTISELDNATIVDNVVYHEQVHSLYLQLSGKRLAERNSSSFVEKKHKRRVFIYLSGATLAGMTRQSNNPICSHLAFIAEISELFDNTEYEITVIVSCLPYPFPAPKIGGGKKFYCADPEVRNTVKKTTKSNLLQLVNPKNPISILVPGEGCNKNSTLDQYLTSIQKEISQLNLSSEDITIAIGGVKACFYLRKLITQYSSINYIMPMNTRDPYIQDYVNDFDYIVFPTQHAIEKLWPNLYAQNRFVVYEGICKPFLWEKDDGYQEESINAKLLELNICPKEDVILSAGNKFSLRCTESFIKNLQLISQELPNAHICIIGDTEDKLINSFPQHKVFIQTFKFISSHPRIYTFFKTIAQRNKCVYTYPYQHSGSGRTNTFAALAGIPVVVSNLNDAMLSLPNICGCSSEQELQEKIIAIVKNNDYKEKVLSEIQQHLERKEQIAKLFPASLSKKKVISVKS